MAARHRLKPAWGDALVVLCVVLAAVAIAFSLRPAKSGAVTAKITVDGQLLATYDLSALQSPVLLPIDGPYPLTLSLSRDGVAVIETTCPGRDCQRSGTISQPGRQIICLPNKLVVTLTGSALPYDAITG